MASLLAFTMPKSNHRRQDNSKSPSPFLSREAFRLVLQLENQKTSAVDVVALERRFRVPSGYGDDESGESKRSSLPNGAPLDVPGPGAYDAPKRWPLTSTKVKAIPNVGFLSTTAPSQPSLQREQSAPTLNRPEAPIAPQNSTARPSTAVATSSGRSFSRSQRWPSTTQALLYQKDSADRVEYSQSNVRESLYSSFRPTSAATFKHSPRNTHPTSRRDVPPIGSYEVKRFLDSDNSRNSALPNEKRQSFGAMTEKRQVMWGPTFTPPSNAIPTAWNSSQHYAKQKRKIGLLASKQKCATKDPSVLRATLSSSALPVTHTLPGSSEASTVALENDPFAWVREQANGEDRANFLASKFGLVSLIKKPKTQSKALGTDTIGTSDASVVVVPAGRLSKQLSDDQLLRESEQAITGEFTFEYQHAAHHRGQRLAVSCRLPGGMVVTVNTFSQRKLRQLKTAIARRCSKRFANENDFDVFSLGGYLLGNLEASLTDLGLASQHASPGMIGLSTMVQVIPRQSPNRIPELGQIPAPLAHIVIVDSLTPVAATSSDNETP